MDKVLITGGTGRVGKVLTEHLLIKGYYVIATTTSVVKNEVFIQKMKSISSNIEFFELNIQKPEDVHDFISFNSVLLSDSKYLINNARNVDNLSTNKDEIISSDKFSFENLFSVYLPYCLVFNLKKSLRSVVNISSMYGVVPPNGNLYEDAYDNSPIHYGIYKSAQIHLTKELAVRLSKDGINVNCISYGGIEGRVNKDFLEKYSQLCPAGRMLQDIDLIPVVDFLLSSPIGSITGQNIIVDGGWSVW